VLFRSPHAQQQQQAAELEKKKKRFFSFLGLKKVKKGLKNGKIKTYFLISLFTPRYIVRIYLISEHANVSFRSRGYPSAGLSFLFFYRLIDPLRLILR
jgi:hypothetical protein